MSKNTVIEILRNYLENNGYDGLICEECYCELQELCFCELDTIVKCRPAIKRLCKDCVEKESCGKYDNFVNPADGYCMTNID